MVRGSLPLPETIGRFQIQALLGRGGMGEVYKAVDPTLQRIVAVKTIRPDIDRPEYLDRMMREAQACARLSHPNIVTVFEAGQAEHVVYIAMEFLVGENLADALKTKALRFEEKVRILIKVLEALHHAHAQDVVHRDIKPSNIHLMTDGGVKLMDFGLARVLTADTLTASGNVLGTPHYASPEQLKGEMIDRRTDVYSMGVMAYEMLAGRRPFEPDNESISSVIIKVINEPPKPMDTNVSRLLPEIETIVSKAIAKSPKERYQTADDMRRALVTFLDSSRARLSSIDSGEAAAVTRLMPSSAATAADSVPTEIGVRQPSAVETSPSGAEKGNRWVWVGGAAAAAVLLAVVSLGLPSTNAEPSAVATPAPVPAPPVVAQPTGAAAANVASPAGNPAATPDRTAAVSVPVKPVAAKLEAGSPTPAPIESAAVPRNGSAKDMFESTSTSAAAAVAPGLRFRMKLEGPNGQAIDVDPARDFHTGERIKFAFESNIDGYLYVAQQGTSGNWTVLYPHPDINGGLNRVKRFEEYEVPNDNWFQLQGNPGEEQLFVFLSRDPMNTLPGFDRPVKAFERSSPTLVAQLQGQIASRDLILSKDSTATKGMQATYVVNKADLGKAVTAKFTINHKP
jgi:eukaryotic-like serine/threonine-protein kinase